MRPTSVSLTSATSSAVIAVDYHVPANITVDFTSAGTLTYSVEYTADDIFASGYSAGSGTWLSFDEANAITTAKSFRTPFTCRAVRLTVSSYTSGTVRMTVSQNNQYAEVDADNLMDAFQETGGPSALQESVAVAANRGNSVKNAGEYASLALAIADMSTGDTLVIPNETFTISNCITVTTSGLHFIWQNPTINVSDSGTSGTITNTSSGKIGIHFKECSDISHVGAVKFVGQGTVGSTTLAGIVYDKCTWVREEVKYYLENMAAGSMKFWCDFSIFSDIAAYRMKGNQTFGAGTAGSAEVVVGCTYSHFGNVTSKENYKPVRYLSVAADGAAATIDNYCCTFGKTTGTVATSSIEGSVLAVRSAKDCVFDLCTGDGFSNGLYLVRYNTDSGWSVTGNRFAGVSGRYPSTGASVDAALLIDAPSGYEIGNNQIGSVIAQCAGEWGFFIGTGAGEVQIGQIAISGSPTRGGMVHSSAAQIGQFSCTGQGYQALLYGQGAKLDIGLIDIRSGTSAGTSLAVLYDSAYGSGGQLTPNIGNIRYRHNSIGTDYQVIAGVLTGGAEMMNIGHIDGTGSVDQCYFGGDYMSCKFGRVYSSSAPTVTTYSKDFIVWKKNVANGGSPGWINTGASGSNSWRTMAAIS